MIKFEVGKCYRSLLGYSESFCVLAKIGTPSYEGTLIVEYHGHKYPSLTNEIVVIDLIESQKHCEEIGFKEFCEINNIFKGKNLKDVIRPYCPDCEEQMDKIYPEFGEDQVNGWSCCCHGEENEENEI